MAKFKVIDPKGFHLGGKTHQKGDTFDGETKNAHVCTGLHFKQICKVGESKAVENPVADPESDSKPSNKPSNKP